MRLTEHRTLLAEILIDSGIFYLRDHGLEDKFIAGEIDPNFEEMDIDSLATMELCIALETSWNLAVVPEDIHSLGSLQKILDLIEA